MLALNMPNKASSSLITAEVYPIGFLSFNGDCNTGITIRSVHVKNNFSIIRAGGGIVSLSNPENELNETKLKMSKTLSVLGVEL